ncbi:MAG: hypothetical protein QW604_01410 [Fervidicoccaceae archaeon]
MNSTGRITLEPTVISFVSRLPPCLPGVPVGVLSDVATPITPIILLAFRVNPWNSTFPSRT